MSGLVGFKAENMERDNTTEKYYDIIQVMRRLENKFTWYIGKLSRNEYFVYYSALPEGKYHSRTG